MLGVVSTTHPLLRLLCSAVILAGFGLGGWLASTMVIMIHDGDAPWMVRDRVYPWDGYAVGILVALIGIFGGVRALRRPRLDTPTWSFFVVAACILLLLLVSLLVSLSRHANA
jgi:cell division protein FtsW (lipid II flippase)